MMHKPFRSDRPPIDGAISIVRSPDLAGAQSSRPSIDALLWHGFAPLLARPV
jgi:hypothetical protein